MMSGWVAPLLRASYVHMCTSRIYSVRTQPSILLMAANRDHKDISQPAVSPQSASSPPAISYAGAIRGYGGG